MRELRAEEFYQFMQKREQIRINRRAGLPWPWTDDKILQTYSFTNVKREHDRTSIKFREDLFEPHEDAPFEQVLLNAATARFFGRAEFVCIYVGWQEDFNEEFLLRAVANAKADDQKVWTAAYMITAGGQSLPKEQIVVRQYLAGLWRRMPKLREAFDKNHSWKDLLYAMSHCEGFGGTGFMSKETILDTMFTKVWPIRIEERVGSNVHGRHVPSDWSTWCPAGPGARRGVARVLGQPVETSVNETLALEVMRQLYALRDDFWPSYFHVPGTSFGSVSLDLHDIQFQLCEFDKYERARLGEGKPKKIYRHATGNKGR